MTAALVPDEVEEQRAVGQNPVQAEDLESKGHEGRIIISRHPASKSTTTTTTTTHALPFVAPSDLLRVSSHHHRAGIISSRPTSAAGTRAAQQAGAEAGSWMNKPMTPLDREQLEGLVRLAIVPIPHVSSSQSPVADNVPSLVLACRTSLPQGQNELRCAAAQLPPYRLRHVATSQKKSEHPHHLRSVYQSSAIGRVRIR